MTFGSQLAQVGVSIFKIQKWMGRSDPRMTMKHYAHLSPEYDEDINRIPGFAPAKEQAGRLDDQTRRASAQSRVL